MVSRTLVAFRKYNLGGQKLARDRRVNVKRNSGTPGVENARKRENRELNPLESKVLRNSRIRRINMTRVSHASALSVSGRSVFCRRSR